MSSDLSYVLFVHLLNFQLVDSLSPSFDLLLFENTACSKENEKNHQVYIKYDVKGVFAISASTKVWDFYADSIVKELLRYVATGIAAVCILDTLVTEILRIYQRTNEYQCDQCQFIQCQTNKFCHVFTQKNFIFL